LLPFGPRCRFPNLHQCWAPTTHRKGSSARSNAAAVPMGAGYPIARTNSLRFRPAASHPPTRHSPTSSATCLASYHKFSLLHVTTQAGAGALGRNFRHGRNRRCVVGPGNHFARHSLDRQKKKYSKYFISNFHLFTEFHNLFRPPPTPLESRQNFTHSSTHRPPYSPKPQILSKYQTKTDYIQISRQQLPEKKSPNSHPGISSPFPSKNDKHLLFV